MELRPYGLIPDGFRGDGTPFRGALVEHADRGGPDALVWAIFALLLVLLLLAIASLAFDLYHRHRDPQSAPESVGDGPPPTHGPSSGALTLLDDRYARGEIPRDDYLQARDDLRGVTDAPTQVIPPEPKPA